MPDAKPRPAAARTRALSQRSSSTVNTMEGAVLRALSMTGKPKAKKAASRDIVRFRPKGGADRRIEVEYFPDPERRGSVLMRLTPATAAALPAPAGGEELLGTQAAADLLNVSRPYLTKLVDAGTFDGVVRTAAGHRRIPRAEVERVHTEMRATRRAALTEIDKATARQRAGELEAARAKSKRRWV